MNMFDHFLESRNIVQQPNNPNTTNPIIEVALAVVAVLLIIGDIVLLYLSKIDIGFASSILIAAFSLLGINLAYKAPSPTQVAQQNAQQQNVTNVAQQALAVLPMFANLLHSHASAPVAVPQQQAQAQPTAPTAVMRQPITQTPVAQPQVQQDQVPADDPRVQAAATGPQPTTTRAGTAPQAAMAGRQFKPPVFTPLPDISMPMAAMLAGQQQQTQ